MPEHNSTEETDPLVAIAYCVGLVAGYLGWDFCVDSSKMEPSLVWLGQGVTIAISVAVVPLAAMFWHPPKGGWIENLKATVAGSLFVLLLWGTGAAGAYWGGNNFATGAWCAALSVFGLVWNIMRYARCPSIPMCVVYGLFLLVGVTLMLNANDGDSIKESQIQQHD